jgi:tetratricopeptide (TPR) repeat protein
LTAVLLAVLWVSSAGCALVGKGAGQRSECSRIAGLAHSGDHKLAVDAALALAESGKSCSPDVMEAVSRSRTKLQKADSYVHKALKRRKEGNLLSARANLQQALNIYPRYYWVQTLIKNIDSSIQAELDSLRNEASYFESIGNPEGALTRIQDAILLSPGDGSLESEAVRLKEVISAAEAEADQSVQGLLNEARSHLEMGRFDEAQQLLTEGGAPEQLGARGEELLAEVMARRREHLEVKLSDALDKEKKGDLGAAADQTLYILKRSVPGTQLSVEIVEFARLLGMKLYSAGELSRAKELWTSALILEPENLKLQGYLKEVETRLENLDRIKKGGADSGGK